MPSRPSICRTVRSGDDVSGRIGAAAAEQAACRPHADPRHRWPVRARQLRCSSYLPLMLGPGTLLASTLMRFGMWGLQLRFPQPVPQRDAKALSPT